MIYSLLSTRRKPFGDNTIILRDVVILSVSRGHGVICSDLLQQYDLNAVKFTEQERLEVKVFLNPIAREIASFNNSISFLKMQVIYLLIERLLSF